MRRATITVPDHLDNAVKDFVAAQPARPSLTSVVEAALEAYLAAPTSAPQSRLPEVMRRRARIVELATARGATSIGLFGSVADATDTAASDVDFWVTVGPEMGLFDLAALRHDLQQELGARVDVLTLGGLSETDQEALRAKSLAL